MPDEKTAELEAQKQDEETAKAEAEAKVDAETKEKQAVEDGKSDAEDDDKQKADPYQKQIDELQTNIAKKDEIIKQKERALQAMKKEKKEEKDDEDENQLGDEIKELKQTVSQLQVTLTDRLATTDLDSEVNALTDNLKEREAIKLHYKHSIVRTDDLKKDLLKAMAVANQEMVMA